VTYETAGPVENGPIVKRREEDNVIKRIIARRAYVALCCGRQTGKTTFMYQLRERLRALGAGVAYLYLGGLRDVPASRFYERICIRILEDLDKWLRDDVARPNAQNVIDQPAFGDFIHWVALKSGRCNRVVIMLDEVGAVPEAFSRSFWGGLRAIFHEKGILDKVTFVLAGELDMNEMATGNNSPLLNVCVTVDLQDFTRDDVRTLAAVALPTSDALVDGVYYWTGGHPYLTQKVCELVEAAVSADENFLKVVSGVDPVKKIIDEHFRFDVDPNLVHIRNYLNSEPEHRKRVRTILENGPMPYTQLNHELAVVGIVKLGSDRH
jgi:hypothetical protein